MDTRRNKPLDRLITETITSLFHTATFTKLLSATHGIFVHSPAENTQARIQICALLKNSFASLSAKL